MKLRVLLTYVVPRVELITHSSYNPEIRVLQESGEYKLLVNGSRQSGRYIRQLWQHAMDVLGVHHLKHVKKIAVLGVAGGTVIHLLHSMFPKAHITGVDIDPVMIDLGKRYFNLGALPIALLSMDAQDFIAHQKKNAFDLIVVDLFIGRAIPDFVQDEKFLRKLKSITSSGAVLINYLRELEYGKRADLLSQTLQKIWTTVSWSEQYNNRFFFVR